MSVLHINARSASNKGETITDFLSEFQFKFKLILLTETWYHDDGEIIQLDGYNPFVLNRKNRRGGGVAIYVDSSLKFQLLSEFSKITNDYEMLTIKLNRDIVSVLYRPPSANAVPFFAFYESFLDYVNINNLRLICAGDFNIHSSEHSALGNTLHTSIASSGFVNIITTPTRVTTHSSSILDLIITNLDTVIFDNGTITSDISDHCPVFVLYCSDNRHTSRRSKPVSVQCVSDEGLELFKRDISLHDWSSVLNESNVNVAYRQFLESFVQIYNSHFPFKSFKPTKRIKKPWVTKSHLATIKKKNRLYHRFLITRLPAVFDEFKKTRNALNSQLRRAKQDYYLQLFADISPKQPHATWKLLNHVLGRTNKRSFPESVMYNNLELTGKALAHHFNEYFVNIVPQVDDVEAIDNPITESTGSFFLAPTDQQEVYSTFMNLSNSKALDTDNLQIKPVKFVIETIAPVLTHIYNLSFESGIFPDGMKKSRVSVIYKSGDRNSRSNYRPISVISVFSKAIEKLLLFRLTSFFDRGNILSDAQYGFRKNKSTEKALLTMKENILQNIENKHYTLGLFIDFTKAFDCLNHSILIHKLMLNGVRGTPLSLLRSYLTNRQQCVCIGDHISSFLPTTSGVPQGSVLGPLLFNVFVNDIVQIDSEAKFIMYADDCTLLISGECEDNLVMKCNAILERLHFWSQSNRIHINPAKTKVVIFRAKHKQVKLNHIIKYSNNTIEIVDEIKILGVTFSACLSWNTHINNICKKLSSATGALARTRSLLPTKTKIKLYYALFESHLNYCSLVWATTTKTNITKILTLQKKIMRLISGADYLSPTRDIFKSCNVIAFQHMYHFRILRSFYFSSGPSKDFLTSTALLTHSTNIVNTRNTDIWHIHRFRTNYKLQSLQHNLPDILNKYKTVQKFSFRETKQYFVDLVLTHET